MKKITPFIFFIIGLISFYGNAQANNDCATAETLTVGPLNTCSNVVLATIDGTVTDSGVDDPGCGDYSNGPDLWYQLSMPASGGVRIETSNSGSINDTGMAVYSGACGSLQLIRCNDDIVLGSDTFSGINVTGALGETVYIRVWEFGGGTAGTFNICAYAITPPPVAANDDCSTAEELTLNLNCTPVNGSNNATNSEDIDSTIPGVGCANYLGSDVWYWVKVPESGKVTIETTEDDDRYITDNGIAVYFGTCDPSGLSLQQCNDSGNPNSIYDFGRIALTGLTPDEIVYVRVWAYDNAELGGFKICAIDPDGSLGVDDFKENNFKMYPNPLASTDILNFKFDNFTDNSVKIDIINIQGKLVMSKNEMLSNNKISLNLDSLSNGLYFVKITTSESMVTKKLIIK